MCVIWSASNHWCTSMPGVGVCTCRSDILHKITQFLLISAEVHDLGHVGIVFITVVAMGYDRNSNARDLLLQTFYGLRNLTTNLGMGHGRRTLTVITKRVP